MKSKYFIWIIILLVVINFLLLYKNYILKKQIKADIDIMINPPLSVKSVPYFVLYDLNGVMQNSQEIVNNFPFTLLVFFSPTDCASCLEEKNLWNIILKEGEVGIVGIARHIDEKELKDWIENSEIFFPVFYDVESIVTEKFGIIKTPMKVLVNNMGEILLFDRVRITLSAQEEFIEELDKILGH